MPEEKNQVNRLTPKLVGREDVERWLFEFQRAIRHADYSAGRALFHPKAVGFGTIARRVDSLDQLEKRQWRKRWSQNKDFQYLTKEARVIPGAGMFIIAVEWEVPSPILGAAGRSGRATFVLLDFEGKLLCVHSHHSENP